MKNSIKEIEEYLRVLFSYHNNFPQINILESNGILNIEVKVHPSMPDIDIVRKEDMFDEWIQNNFIGQKFYLKVIRQ